MHCHESVTLSCSPPFAFHSFAVTSSLLVNTRFPAALAQHLAESVHAARRRYRNQVRQCRKKFSGKSVHELRIETRRILALIHLLEALQFEDGLKKLRKLFKKRLDAFDELRDTHVQLDLLKPLWPDFPETRDFKKLLRRRKKKLGRELSRHVQSLKNAQLNRRLKKLEKTLLSCSATPTAERGGALALAALGHAFRGVALLRRQVRKNEPKTIHRLRVGFKRFRYMTELLDPFLATVKAKQLDQIKAYQTLAGDVQDREVLLATLDCAVRDGEISRRSAKGLRTALIRQRRNSITAFMSQIDQFRDFEPQPAAASVAG